MAYKDSEMERIMYPALKGLLKKLKGRGNEGKTKDVSQVILDEISEESERIQFRFSQGSCLKSKREIIMVHR